MTGRRLRLLGLAISEGCTTASRESGTGAGRQRSRRKLPKRRMCQAQPEVSGNTLLGSHVRRDTLTHSHPPCRRVPTHLPVQMQTGPLPPCSTGSPAKANDSALRAGQPSADGLRRRSSA